MYIMKKVLGLEDKYLLMPPDDKAGRLLFRTWHFFLEKKISINIGYDIRRHLAEDKEAGAA